MLRVTYSERRAADGRFYTRIISARDADRKERRAYEQNRFEQGS